MKRTIKIVAVSDAGGAPHPEPHADHAAGVDTDIFEADSLTLDGERFWESFWQTQYTYGGIHEGQSLAEMFGMLDADVFGKLCQDVRLVCTEPARVPEEATNDIVGMVIFLLCIEKGDPQYDPIAQEGYEGALGRFSTAAVAEQQRRTGAVGGEG